MAVVWHPHRALLQVALRADGWERRFDSKTIYRTSVTPGTIGNATIVADFLTPPHDVSEAAAARSITQSMLDCTMGKNRLANT